LDTLDSYVKLCKGHDTADHVISYALYILHDKTRSTTPAPSLSVRNREFIGPAGRYTCVCKHLVFEFITGSRYGKVAIFGTEVNGAMRCPHTNDKTTESGSSRMTLKLRPRPLYFFRRETSRIIRDKRKLYEASDSCESNFLGVNSTD